MVERELCCLLQEAVNGRISSAALESFLEEYRGMVSDHAYETITHYVDDEKIRRQDKIYEIWMRLFLFEEYWTIRMQGKFALYIYFGELAKVIGGTWMSLLHKGRVRFELRKRIGFALKGWTFDFDLSTVEVSHYKCRWLTHSHYSVVTIYLGDWLGLDFNELARKIVDETAKRQSGGAPGSEPQGQVTQRFAYHKGLTLGTEVEKDFHKASRASENVAKKDLNPWWCVLFKRQKEGRKVR